MRIDALVFYRLEDQGNLQVQVSAETTIASDDAVRDALASEAGDESIVLTITESLRAQPESSAFGGMTFQNQSGTKTCTSGFNIVDAYGTYGLTTAAHCGSDVERAIADNHDHTLPYVNHHYGGWGDVQWGTGGVNFSELFRSNWNEYRTVKTVEAKPHFQQGEFVCLFGVQGGKDCSARIWAVDATCNPTGVAGLGLLDRDIGVLGDSGGPLFWGNNAMGIHYGDCGTSYSLFTLADYFDEAINADVIAEDRLNRGQVLWPGDTVKAINPNSHLLAMQTDGNLVLYYWGTVKWCACWEGAPTIPGSRAVMQTDGNFVIYNPWNQAIWASNTQVSRAQIKLQTDGNLVMYDGWGTAVWVR
ncbi:MAG: hypothetical protein AAGA65_20260 [Actinomycetota bacterium]